MVGRLILVVGPSGAGKDTLLAAAADRLKDSPEFVFPRRMITRHADAGGENHIAITPDQYDAMITADDYTLAWRAHGLGYALPSEVKTLVGAGQIVVCNGSRAVLARAMEQFSHARVVLITASRPVRAHRLAARGREDLSEIEARLERETPLIPPNIPAIEIDNSGQLTTSISEFCDTLQQLAKEPAA